MRVPGVHIRQSVFIILCCLGAFSSLWGTDKVHITVEAGLYDRINCIVAADISSIDQLSKGPGVSLYETVGEERREVACQLLEGKDGKPYLYWVLTGKTPAGTMREFVVEPITGNNEVAVMKIEDTGKALVLKKNESEILQYNYVVTNPPSGVDTVYQRSGFIHPAYAPSGNILTTIQPKDHYHHFGVWNPWTRVEYEGNVYDLWNLGDKQGTVRARNVEKTFQGSVCAGYSANLDHYIFSASGEKIVMNESWRVKSWNIPERFLWDFESTLQDVTSLPINIKAYRYGGFVWRGTQEWTKDNCIMLTSEGKSRSEIDGTTARWIYVTGTCGGDKQSGFLLLGHPDNYNAPEPLRIWDEKANDGRGDVFVNFAPTKYKDWQLMPGKDYTLRYRICTYDGEMTVAEANRLWNDYAYPPRVIVRKQ